MGVFVGTAGSTAYFARTNTSLDFNAAYTICFSFYIPTASTWANENMYNISGSTLATSSSPGSRRDGFGGSSGAFWKMMVANSAGTLSSVNSTTGPTANAIWRRVALRRMAAGGFKARIHTPGGGGSLTITNTSQNFTSIAGREATNAEYFFWDGANGLNVGGGIMNYKAFSGELTDQEIDDELYTTVPLKLSMLHSHCPLTSTTDMPTNALVGTQTDFGNSWAYGAGVIAGANDPDVVIGVGHAMGSGTMATHGYATVHGDPQAFTKYWRMPSNAAPGTAARMQIFETVVANADYLVEEGAVTADSGGYFTLRTPTTNNVGTKKFAVVHNWNGTTGTTSIFGGPGIAELISVD